MAIILISLQKAQLLFNRRYYVIFMISREGPRGFYCYCYNKSRNYLAAKCYNCGALGHIRAQCRRPRRRERKEYKEDSDVGEIHYHFHGAVQNLKVYKYSVFNVKCLIVHYV